jgi:galactoside 2-L-fucosyltransferase 1/2
MVKIRRIFLKFIRKDLVSKVQSYLHGLKLKPNPVFISVHVRRTDYINWIESMFKGKPVDSSYFLHSMSHFIGKFSNPIFLITSDDLPWCRNNLVNNMTAGKILFPSDDLKTDSEEENVAIDLVTLAQANHSSKISQVIDFCNLSDHVSVYDYGSFGFLGSVMAGGEVLVADGYSNNTHPILQALRNKTPQGWKLVDVKKIA